MNNKEGHTQIPIQVSNEVKSKLKMVCLAQNRSMSGYCAEALREKLVKDWDGAFSKVGQMTGFKLPTQEKEEEDL